jgi:hypothetical protein
MWSMSNKSKLVRQITHDPTVTIDSVYNSLTLELGVHKMFDKYMLGIYTGHGGYQVHVFTSRPLKLYHGQPLLLRAESTFEERWPNVKLLEWHYRQCLMARIRASTPDN